MKGWQAIALGVMLLLGAVVGWRAFRAQAPIPEEQARRQVVRMVEWADKKDIGGIMEGISQNFRLNDGLSRDEFKAFLLGQMFRQRWVRVFLASFEARKESETRVLTDIGVVLGGSDAKSLKELAIASRFGTYKIEATFEKESDGEWRCVKATYRSVDVNQL